MSDDLEGDKRWMFAAIIIIGATWIGSMLMEGFKWWKAVIGP